VQRSVSSVRWAIFHPSPSPPNRRCCGTKQSSPRYEELYRRGAYLPEAQRREIERAAGVPWLRTGDRQRWKHRVIERRRVLEREARERAAEAAAARRGVSDGQEALF
jgi:hypothetical protein